MVSTALRWERANQWNQFFFFAIEFKKQAQNPFLFIHCKLMTLRMAIREALRIRDDRLEYKVRQSH